MRIGVAEGEYAVTDVVETMAGEEGYDGHAGRSGGGVADMMKTAGKGRMGAVVAGRAVEVGVGRDMTGPDDACWAVAENAPEGGMYAGTGPWSN